MSDKSFRWTSRSVDETKKGAALLASYIQPGTVITLDGEVGAGKTHFTQGLAVGMGITGVVNSPTFSLVKSYEGRKLPLYHMDLYRLSQEEAEELGLEEMIEGQGVSVVEWSDRIAELLPAGRIEIRIEILDLNHREIEVIPYGTEMLQVVQDWMKAIRSETG
jgi:tRNA threonylcarbamoyladenosine biosynthesis protein TsaE